MQKWIHLSEQINGGGKTGWNQILSEGFNGSVMPFWESRWCWANHHFDSPFCTTPDNWQVNPDNGTVSLVTKVDGSAYPGAGCDFALPFSSGTLNSDPCSIALQDLHTGTEGRLYKYGFFEARIKNPRSRQMWPAFWLYGPENPQAQFVSKWNEIDIYEYGVSDQIFLTNWFDTDVEGASNSSGSKHYAMPGQQFGDRWVTYGLRWEPNKLIWYIDNQVVRIFVGTESQPVPETWMRVKLNSGIHEHGAEYDGHLPLVLPNYMEIDYVRVWQRPDVRKAYPLFTVNGRQGGTKSNPASLPYSSTTTFSLNASESYMPNNSYTITVQRMAPDGSGELQPIGIQASTTQVLSIEQSMAFDLRQLCNQEGVYLIPGHVYKIQVRGGQGTQNQATTFKYYRLDPCVRDVKFTVNGLGHTHEPIHVPYNFSKTRVILDPSDSQICGGVIYLGVIECDAAGQDLGAEVGKWFAGSDPLAELRQLDLEHFLEVYGEGMALQYGHDYRIKVASSSDDWWEERNQRIHVEERTQHIEFSINGSSVPFPQEITVLADERVILDGSNSTFTTNRYYLKIDEWNSEDGVVVGQVYSGMRELKTTHGDAIFYDIGTIDLRAAAAEQQRSLRCGRLYRIRLGTEDGTVFQEKLVRVGNCETFNGEFDLGTELNATVEDWLPHDVQGGHYFYTDDQVTLRAPNSSSCDRTYVLTAQKLVDGVLVGSEFIHELNWKQIYRMKVTQSLKLLAFLQDPDEIPGTNYGLQVEQDSRYLIKMIPGHGDCRGYNEWYAEIQFGNGSAPGGSGQKGNFGMAQTVDVCGGFATVRNGLPGRFTLDLKVDGLGITVWDSSGRIVQHESNAGLTWESDAMPTGVYLVELRCSAGVDRRRMAVTW